MNAPSIKTIAAADTHTIELRDGADNPLVIGDEPVTVTVYGPGTVQYRKAKSAQEARAIARLQRRGKADASVKEQLEQKAQFLADITHSWNNWAYAEYQDLTGRELSLAIYGAPEIGFICDQVHQEVHDWANFSKTSAKP